MLIKQPLGLVCPYQKESSRLAVKYFKMFTEYYTYIKSKEWFDLKIDIIQKRGCLCEVCKKPKNPAALQLHHLSYKRLFNELPQDLLLICRKCHMKEHGLTKKPIPKKLKKKKGKIRYKLTKRDRALQKRYDKHRI